MRPNASSSVLPVPKMPWCAHTTRRQSLIFSAVAAPMSFVPDTIHGTTPMPSGNTTIHSVIICQSVQVKSRSSMECTKVMAIVFAGWQCMTTLCSGSAFSLAIWFMRWVGNSLVGNVLPSKPQSSSSSLPFDATRTIPRFPSGSLVTFLKYLPVPVTRNRRPASSAASKSIGILRMVLERSR